MFLCFFAFSLLIKKKQYRNYYGKNHINPIFSFITSLKFFPTMPFLWNGRLQTLIFIKYKVNFICNNSKNSMVTFARKLCMEVKWLLKLCLVLLEVKNYFRPVQNLLNRIRNNFSLLNFTFSTKFKIFDLFKIFQKGSKQFGQI